MSNTIIKINELQLVSTILLQNNFYILMGKAIANQVGSFITAEEECFKQVFA